MNEEKRFHIIDGFRQSPPLDRRHQFGQGRNPQDSRRSDRASNRTAPAGGQLTVALKATEKRLSSLLEDRRRISRDLHDSVLQSLYAIGLSLETSHRTNTSPRPERNRPYSHAVDQLNRLIHEVRGIIKGLADGSVQDMDLSEELKQLAGSYKQLDSITITLSLQSSALDVLTREEEQEILNIVREALSNCVRHAQATHVEVTIKTHGNRVRISICDDGKGFVETGAHPKGYGLMNMEARAKKLGGSLLLRSKPGQGTRITAEFLLEPMLAPV